MTERYSFIERAVPKGHKLELELSVEKSNNSAFKIYRLLLGTCNIRDDFFQREFKFRSDYLAQPYERRSKVRFSDLLQHLPDEMDHAFLAKYFSSLKANDDFYSMIEFELISCLIARDRLSYLEAFIFLYRMIEGISYAVPLIYMSKSKSFEKTFSSLQACMPKSDKEGELIFFRKFIDSHWNKESFYKKPMTVDLSLVEFEELRPKYFLLYKKLLDEKAIEQEVEDEQILIKFPNYMDFMISIRNRYFHFLQGTWRQNIKTGEIVFPDVFFKPILDLGISWVATCLFEVIKFDLNNHHKK